MCCLNAWHNGKYYKGLELDLKERKLDEIIVTGSSTFQTVYELREQIEKIKVERELAAAA